VTEKNQAQFCRTLTCLSYQFLLLFGHSFFQVIPLILGCEKSAVGNCCWKKFLYRLNFFSVIQVTDSARPPKGN